MPSNHLQIRTLTGVITEIPAQRMKNVFARQDAATMEEAITRFMDGFKGNQNFHFEMALDELGEKMFGCEASAGLSFQIGQLRYVLCTYYVHTSTYSVHTRYILDLNKPRLGCLTIEETLDRQDSAHKASDKRQKETRDGSKDDGA
jgi:hypothetical protein